jgi:methyl-accepting chemotaxis protein
MRSITTKLVVFSLAGCALVAAALGVYLIFLNRSSTERSIAQLDGLLRSDFDRLARTQVENAASMLDGVAAARDRGELTPAQAERLAAGLLRGLRYGGEGYFWADTLDGTNVVLLGRDAEGKNRLAAVDAHGNRFIEAIRDRAVAGGGFTEWWFPRKGGGEPAPKRGYSAVSKPFQWVIGTGNYLDDIEGIIASQRERARAEASRQLSIILAIVGAALLAAAALAVVMGRRLARPVLELTAALGRMGEGDFAAGDDLRGVATLRDESGRMARALLAMRASIGETVRGVQGTAEAIAAASAELEVTARAMSKGAGEQATAVHQTMSSSQEIAQMARRGAERAAGVVDATHRSEHLVGGGEEAVARVRQEIEALGSQVTTIEDATVGLTQKARRIDAIAASVKDLAEQSHNLSINASLEAARAGEAGRGFAVVARELGDLAARSLAASKEVRGLVREIVEASSGAIHAAQEGTARARDAVELSRTADASLAGLADVVRGAVAAARDIAQGTHEQNLGVEQVSAAVGEISQVARATAETARDVERASATLAEQSAALRSSVQRFST